MGPIQLDGFIKDRNFDLTLRSKNNISESLSNDLRQLFKSAVDANGYSGSLFIKQHTTFPVNVQDALLKTQKSTTASPYSA
jgi:hypothetical protein